MNKGVRANEISRTYVSCLTSAFPGCNLIPMKMNFGPHHARAPATNATQVKPAVDQIKLQLKIINRSEMHKAKVYVQNKIVSAFLFEMIRKLFERNRYIYKYNS